MKLSNRTAIIVILLVIWLFLLLAVIADVDYHNILILGTLAFLWLFSLVAGIIISVLSFYFDNKRAKPMISKTISYHETDYDVSNSNISELASMGFEQVGTFWHERNGLYFNLNSHNNDSGVYAFMIGEEIQYIGKTHNLTDRMSYYRNSGPNDRDTTNRNVNYHLVSSGQVQIFFLPRWIVDTSNPSRFNIPPMDEKLDYHILETILIKRYKPPWNYYGSKD